MDEALVNLLRDALRYESTDVFLIEGEAPRIRRESLVVEMHPGPVPRAGMEALWSSCGVDHTETKETDASWQVPDGPRLRVNLYHTLGRLAAVMRPIQTGIPGIEELLLPPELLESWCQRSNGLVLCTGPAGSGKSTTVASCLDWINRRMCRHVVTLEDPIEYLFASGNSLFSQREIRLDSEDFATALRSAMRQSPDVLFIGEIRDAETALTALQAAETGQLVVSTMHGGSVKETVSRLINLTGEARSGSLQLLAAQLVGIICQRLLPKAGGGLFPALEYMQNEAGTRRWILEGRVNDLQDHIDNADGATCFSLMDYLVTAVHQGYVDANVARGACPRPQDFDRAMRGIS